MTERTAEEIAAEIVTHCHGNLGGPNPVLTNERAIIAKALTSYADQQTAALRRALVAVTPPFRRPGACWCGIARDLVNFGHEPHCVQALAALAPERGEG